MINLQNESKYRENDNNLLVIVSGNRARSLAMLVGNKFLPPVKGNQQYYYWMNLRDFEAFQRRVTREHNVLECGTYSIVIDGAIAQAIDFAIKKNNM